MGGGGLLRQKQTNKKTGEEPWGGGSQGAGRIPFTQVLKDFIKYIKTRIEDCAKGFLYF